MATYTVHLPPAGQPERTALERVRFIKDAGSLPALVFPALWLLFQRLWYGLVVYLLIALCFAILSRVVGNQALNLLSILPAIYLFLEGGELVRARLVRSGWRFAGVVEAGSLAEAEERWFKAHPPAERPAPAAAPAWSVATVPAAGPSGAEPSIGIFGP